MEDRNQTAAMLIRFYNVVAGTSCRTNNERSQQYVLDALDRANGDIGAVRNHIKSWVAENKEIANGDNLVRCISEFTGVGKPNVADAVAQSGCVTESQVQYSLGMLEQAVVQLISKTQAEKIESEIMSQVQDEVRSFIRSEYGTVERKFVTIIDGERKPVEGVQHEKFETVLKFVANDEPVFLTGPAGSGKNFLCKQVAQALGLNFYFTNAVTQEYKLTGFTDAMGNYHATQFYKAFTEGGLFMLDEMDASIPEVLVILNAAIANRYFDFPAPIGYKEAHKDFRVIAAGNTVGQGASYEYVGRNQLDAASLDRFAVVHIDYSDMIEQSICNGDIDLLTFCRDFRSGAEKAGQKVIVSYRAISRLAKMVNVMSIEEAIRTCLTKGMEKDDIRMVFNLMDCNNKYKKALGNLV